MLYMAMDKDKNNGGKVVSLDAKDMNRCRKNQGAETEPVQPPSKKILPQDRRKSPRQLEMHSNISTANL